MEIDKDKLEKSLSKNSTPKISKESEIGFHQGALNTLAAEKMELLRVVENIEKIMQMHLLRLEELGVKFDNK
ncbi:hypothetical protein COU58_01295 [Candidatus Pacearchaeota archaeon CG10_big_fil_rev_8_21_14_0_10_32_42]|nr:MAG: hypothetical protein COU58_01295 [Candidatus Pacearchaeota archaeon CG10_big_fil_rev_8_21_14_0_10_32_42]